MVYYERLFLLQLKDFTAVRLNYHSTLSYSIAISLKNVQFKFDEVGIKNYIYDMEEVNDNDTFQAGNQFLECA